MDINYNEYWNKYALTYTEYNDVMDQQVIDGLTSGPTQSEGLSNYTKLNDSRMHRLDKKIQISENLIEKLNKISIKKHWLIITETWCGDAAQILPFVDKIAELSENISAKYIWRDQFPELINNHLTNGAKSIPMVIILSEDNSLLGDWGPRPKIAQKMVMSNKEKMSSIEDPTLRSAHYQQFKVDLQKWYNKNKGIDIQNELIDAALKYS